MRREETIPEKAQKVVAEVTETKKPTEDASEGGKTFVEHVSEYVGRLWGSAKNLVGQGSEATGRRTEEARDYGSRNMEDAKELAEDTFGGTKKNAKENKEALAQSAKEVKEEAVEIGKNVKESFAGSK